MVSFLKSLQSIFSKVLSDLPDGVKVVTEFVYRVRWFIVWGFVLVGLYNMVMTVLPYLMWSFIIKMVVGSIFSFIAL